MRITTLRVKQTLLTTAVSLFSIAANAQYSQTVEQYPKSDYSTVEATFKLTDVAETLGTDTTTLRTALDAWAEKGEDGTECMFQAYVDNALVPTLPSAYNGNFNGIWFTAEGALGTYATDAAYHAESGWDAVNNTYTIALCQYPSAFKGGEEVTKKYALTYNGKTATFDITYKIKEGIAIPEPATVLRSEMASKLTKIGETDVKATRTTVQGYDATALKADIKGIAEKLGIEKDAWVNVSAMDLLYTGWYDTASGTMKDSLTNTSTANSGWWLRQTVYGQGEEHQGEESPELGAAAYGNTDKIFLEQFALDETGDTLTCNLGQYPDVLAAGDDLYARVYLIYGDKYWQINYNVVCEEAQTNNINEMTMVKEIDAPALTFNQFNSDYEAKNVTLDVDDILSALNATAQSEVSVKGLQDEGGDIYPGNWTANNGYYFNADGYVTSWSNKDASPMFVEEATANEFGSLNVGLFAGNQQNAGSTYVAHLYLIKDNKYVKVNITANVEKGEQASQLDWEVVATKKISAQVTVSGTDYKTEQSINGTLTPAEIEELIGTASPVMYGDLADTLRVDNQLYGIHSSYACTPAPGIWFNQKGECSGYNGTQYTGICWSTSTGAFEIYQMPGKPAVGDNFAANIYFVNAETNKMVKVQFAVSYVSEIKTAEVVGTENIKVYASEEDGDTEFTLDLTNAATALGVAVEDLLNDANNYFTPQNAAGSYTDGVAPTTGYTFNADGSYSSTGDGIYGIAFNEEGQLVTFLNSTPENETYSILTTFGFKVGEKVYVFNVTYSDKETYTTGVETVKTDNVKNGKIYNLQGIEVKTPVKGGIYIQNGKKFVK